ncbi:MAG: 6-phosphofructokinase [Firmicutes bacterium]|nr:6-phosphofructokinase [Bacillota bacterium]
MSMGNIIVGQSGGPTAVINSSLVGVYKTAKDRHADKIYGMLNGIQGFLDERYVDLTEKIKDNLDIELLKRTPSSFLGSCRFKLPEASENEAMYQDIFNKLKKLEIKHFFYIGGNDSMDTIKKLSAYAKEKNYDINFMGVPKTIDNDLAVTDHTPGFGSAAKFIGTTLKEVIRDGLVYDSKNITVVEIMGRNAGWLTAAAGLAKAEDCEGVDMIFLPELPFDVDKFVDKTINLQKDKKNLVIAVSEGIKTADGKYVCELNAASSDFVDSFGHKALGGTASFLAHKLASEIGCKTRSIEFGTLQRCASYVVSRTDLSEAFLAGGQAVKAAFNGESGNVITFERTSNDPYHCTTHSYDVNAIANVEKKVPLEWITNDGTYVSDELVDYIRPLIAGELTPIMTDGLPRHLTINDLNR